MINFDKWNKEFGGEKAVKEVEKAKENQKEFADVPHGTYVAKLESLKLAESKAGKPMLNAQFKIVEGEFKKQCIFYNGVMAANDPQWNGLMIHKVLEFLRSLKVFEDNEIDFDGNFAHFNDLLLDITEEAERSKLKFAVKTEEDGEYTKITIKDTFE